MTRAWLFSLLSICSGTITLPKTRARANGNGSQGMQEIVCALGHTAEMLLLAEVDLDALRVQLVQPSQREFHVSESAIPAAAPLAKPPYLRPQTYKRPALTPKNCTIQRIALESLAQRTGETTRLRHVLFYNFLTTRTFSGATT